jgi:hypothetical protein
MQSSNSMAVRRAPIVKLVAVAVLLLAAAQFVAAQSAPTTVDQVIDRVAQREREQVKALGQYSPLVETYIQRMRKGADGMIEPNDDQYFLGKLDLENGHFDDSLFTNTEGAAAQEKGGFFSGMKRHLASPFRVGSVKFSAEGFAYEIFPDQNDFDRQHYDFTFVQREFLGEVRTLVFDVSPKKGAGNGRFLGRIWVEDKDFSIVRFNGTYVPKPKNGLYFHFDSWRLNVAAKLWAPAYVYSEESDGTVNKQLNFKAQTRIWGYNSKGGHKNAEFSEILVDSPDARDQTPSVQDASPLESKRAFEQMAADNVVLKLERVGLVAPAGDLDKVLQTVVNNLQITNKLDIQPEIHCRVLLTTPLESFSVGHTIVVSRGLIDVLPDEASLAMVLSRELAHIALGHHFDARYAFSDRLLFADIRTYQNLAFGHSQQEEQEADKQAQIYLKNSPYADKIVNAGLFLRQLDTRAAQVNALNQAHLGTSLVSNGHVIHMTELMNSSPVLAPKQLDQIAALPLGGRVKLNPWSNQVAMVKAAPVPITSAADKLPLEVTPFLPHIQRFDAAPAPVSAAK